MKRIDPTDNVFRAAARKLGLSKDEFERRMLVIVRKLDRIERIARGETRMRRIWIEEYTVPEHSVRGHYRYIEDRMPQRRATRAIRRRPNLQLIQGGRR